MAASATEFPPPTERKAVVFDVLVTLVLLAIAIPGLWTGPQMYHLVMLISWMLAHVVVRIVQLTRHSPLIPPQRDV
jgi:hypothetical protein